jgi:hypothetical protein
MRQALILILVKATGRSTSASVSAKRGSKPMAPSGHASSHSRQPLHSATSK